MMDEKQKMQPNRKANWLIFALLWVLLLGAVKSLLFQFGFETDVFDFVNRTAPDFLLKRLWLMHLLEGLGYGLFIGLSQALVLGVLSKTRFKYWAVATTLASVAASTVFYLLVRFNFESFYLMLMNPLFINLSIVFMAITQWFMLRKHFRQAWLWLLLILPNIFLANFRLDLWGILPNSVLQFLRWDVTQPLMLSVIQAIIAVWAILWMSRKSISDEKAKNTAEAEARLSDNLPDDAEALELRASYQASDA